MKTRNSRVHDCLSRIGVFAAMLAFAALSVAGAQEEPQAPAVPDDPPAEAETPPQPPLTGSDAGGDGVFIPSEEIAADEEVTFPVDI